MANGRALSIFNQNPEDRPEPTEKDRVAFNFLRDRATEVSNAYRENEPGRLDRDAALTKQLAERAKAISDHYRATMTDVYSRDDFLPPKKTQTDPIIDTANILLGDELALAGIKMDAENFDWSFDTAINMLSEHPWRSAIAFAGVFAPAFAGLTKARRASKWANVSEADLRAAGRIDPDTPLSSLSDEAQEKLRQQVYNIDRYKALKEKVAGGNASKLEQVEFYLKRQFANGWSHMSDPTAPVGMKADYMDRIQGSIKGEEINRHLADIPIDDRVGVQIAKYFLDPSELKNVPDNAKAWAVNLGNDLRATQRQAYEEGFLPEEVRETVGDLWFSAHREGTKLIDQGETMTLIRKGRGDKTIQLNVPRTASPHLMTRQSTKAELKGILNRQDAVQKIQEGKPEQAMRILKDPEFDEVRGLIERGDNDLAIAKLSDEPFLNVTPESLTVNSLLQQKLLLENFRYIRDISMNPNYTMKAKDLAKLTPANRRQFVSLDDLPNSNIVRRMVQRAGGSGTELGFVHESVFKELYSTAGGQPAARGAIGGLLELLTAVHKTSRTALNLPTHGQNVLGNFIFMSWAGMNMIGPGGVRNFRMFVDSFKAVERVYAAKRSGKSISELTDLGKIESEVVPGKFIDVAEEMNREPVRQLIEMSNIEAAEGIRSLSKLAQESKDGATFTQKLAQGIQRTAKAKPGKIDISVERVADTYMAEDGAAKLAYYLKLRSQGMAPDGAAMEVARRLPVYHSTGEAISSGRKVLLPWLSFPAEAFRIVKNNVQDHPLRMGMWFHATQMLQGMMYPSLGESYQGIEDMKKNLPVWAQRPTGTIITPIRDKNDHIRAAVLDSLPYSSFLPPTVAEEAPLMKKLPLGMSNPMPILTGIVNAMTGRDPWGKEIPGDPNSSVDEFKNITLNMLGFVSPPFVQKYFLNTSTPSPTYRLRQDFEDAVNPYTGVSGDFWFDFVNNNAISAAKLYAASGEQGLANVGAMDRKWDQYRGRLTRDWNAYMKSGDYTSATTLLNDVMRTFTAQWQDPGTATVKFYEWLERHEESLRSHPQLRNFSKEQLIDQLRKAMPDVSTARSSAAAERARALTVQMAMTDREQGKGPMAGGMTGGMGGGMAGGMEGGM